MIRFIHDVVAETDNRNNTPAAPTKRYVHDAALSREDDERAWANEIDRMVADEAAARRGVK